jgi:hypothetical protein
LILEDALRSILHRGDRNRMVFEMASDYVLAFSDGYTRELTPSSLPYVDDILTFLKKISREDKVEVKKRRTKNG